MKFKAKVRCIQGGSTLSILFSTIEVDASDAIEAARLTLAKARMRYPGCRDARIENLAAITIPDDLDIPPTLRRMVVQDGKLKRVAL